MTLAVITAGEAEQKSSAQQQQVAFYTSVAAIQLE